MLIVDWIRHTSLKISGDTCYGQTDIKTADTFEVEAARVREVLARQRYDAVYTSPLSRAEKLAIACGYDEVAIREPRLMERSFGDWELKSWAEIDEMAEKYPELLDAEGQVMPPNGETVSDLLRRVKDFITELRCERHQRVALFCHGGVINSARHLQGLITLPQLFVDVPIYGSVTTLWYAHLDERFIHLK